MAGADGRTLVKKTWFQREKMTRPKQHLLKIYRTPPEKKDRLKFLRLDKNEDNVCLPKETLRKILSKVTPDFLASYPQTHLLYESLSKWLGVSEDNLLVTAGSDAAIKAAFETLVCPGDEVVVPYPTFAMFEVYSKIFRAKVKRVVYEKDLSLPMEKMLKSITSKTKLVALPNPNSPTGTVVERSDILNLLKQAKSKGAAVLIDEAYYHFYPNSVIDLIGKYPNLIVTRTFAKAFGLASVRLGFAAAHPKTIKLLRVTRPMYEVNSFAVLFGCAVLEHPEWMERNVRVTLKGKKYIEGEIKKLGLETFRSHANFILVEVGEGKVRPLVEKMRKLGILIGGSYDHETLKNCIRISLGPKGKMKKAVGVLKNYFGRGGV